MSASGRVHGRKTPLDRRLPSASCRPASRRWAARRTVFQPGCAHRTCPQQSLLLVPRLPLRREQGGPERGLPAQDTRVPGRLPTSPGGVPRCWGDPATLPQGTPSSEGRGAAVAQHPLVCRAAGPPAPGSADSRSLAKTSVCQCPSLQPTDNFTGVWKALLKLTPHGAVSPGPTLANWAPKASRLPHTGSPGRDRPPLTHGWHAFSAHLAATITHRGKNCQIIQWLFN